MRSQCTRHLPVHGRDSAIPKHWQRAVPRILCSEEEGEMEYLARRSAGFSGPLGMAGERYTSFWEISGKTGTAREAFENYFWHWIAGRILYKNELSGSSWRIFTMEAGVRIFRQKKKADGDKFLNG